MLAVAAVGCSSSGSSGGSSSGSSSGPTTTAARYASGFTSNDLVGLTEAEAAAQAEAAGFTVRVIQRDGEAYPGTMDWVETRVNLTIESGVVTRATIG